MTDDNAEDAFGVDLPLGWRNGPSRTREELTELLREAGAQHFRPELTLRDFLLARLADEKDRVHMTFRSWPTPTAPPTTVFGTRAFLDVEARKQIVMLHAKEHTCVEADNGYPGVFNGDESGAWFNPCPTLTALAAVYADHPDYRQEWKA